MRNQLDVILESYRFTRLEKEFYQSNNISRYEYQMFTNFYVIIILWETGAIELSLIDKNCVDNDHNQEITLLQFDLLVAYLSKFPQYINGDNILEVINE